MPPDATETKRRILTAARDEFAMHGLAGARVDRIAETAKANKRSIYVHFGTKEELFDIVVAQSLLELADATPFDAFALPTYAGELFDVLQSRPEVGRLTSWALLERPRPLDAEVEAYRAKAEAIREAQEHGAIARDRDAVELLAMIIALVTSWTNASWSLRSLGTSSDPGVPGPDFRAGMVRAVAEVVAPRR
ncbi:TetR/AcrR family transcriptional regulator [Streptomyces sp. NPDC004726]